MEKRRFLLVTGKFPGVSHDIDGGSIMVSQLIEMLSSENIVDILFTRTFNKNYETIQNVRSVIFHPCKIRSDNKFQRRLQNVLWNSNKIGTLVDNYDKIIIVHCSKAFGLEKLSNEQINKLVLFPMFLTPSYTKSGEVVPKEYTLLEKKILSRLKTIITPCFVEEEELLHFYNVRQESVHVIPRAINPLIRNVIREKSRYNNLIYIASIKKQKSPLEAINVIVRLKEMGLTCHLYIVGSIQDQELLSCCKKMIDDNNLQSNISIMGVLSQQQLASLLNKMDINISVSRWETFGRGIIEGLAAGLPTIVLKDLDCMHHLLKQDVGLLYTPNIASISKMIYKLCTDSFFYKMQSIKTINVKNIFSMANQQKKILMRLE